MKTAIELTAAEAASAFRALKFGLDAIRGPFERERAYAEKASARIGTSVEAEFTNGEAVLRKLATVAGDLIPVEAVPA